MNAAAKPTAKRSWATLAWAGPLHAPGLGQGRPCLWRDGVVSEQLLHVYERLVQLAYRVLYT